MDPPPADRDLRTDDFDYDLPEGRVARYPADRRDASRLLLVRRAGPGDAPGERVNGEPLGDPEFRDLRFRDLVDLVPAGDALVLNDTRVFPARLRGRKPTGAEVEVFLLEPEEDPGTGSDPDAGSGSGAEASPGAEPVAGGERDLDARRWRALVRPGGKLKPGRVVDVAPGFRVHVVDSTADGGRIVELEGEAPSGELIHRHGETPIPPYLERGAEPSDRDRYQTVYAERTGSVAAPTAGLHFTPDLLDALRERGVRLVRVTLHVGVGTFRPVDADRPQDHELHPEAYRVDPSAARTLNRTREAGGRIWAVGTTTVRTLETVAGPDGRIRAGEGWTDLFIHPPHRFRAVDRLITNFHLPRSSLLMLVAAFAGRERTLAAYRHAVEAGYRFYSYGDAMVIV